MRPTANTRLFALLGNPVSHSLSPRIQNAGFSAAGLDAVYLAIACTSEEVPVLMHSLTSNGGGGSVTVPHKEVAARVGRPSPRVVSLGAANVFVAQDDSMAVGNTDVDGITHSLDQLNVDTSSWMIIGTGGSARAVVGAAMERGASIAVRSRSTERAREFMAWAISLGVKQIDPADCELVINATPLGLRNGDLLPVRLPDWPRVRFVLDLVYRVDGTTVWVEAARARGLAALDGRETLLAQGAAAWQLWFPGVNPPLEVMRAALRGHMG